MKPDIDVNNTIGNSTLGASAVTSVASLLVENYSLIMMGIALAGFLVGWYYKRLANRRAEEIHKAKLEAIKNGRE